MKKILMINSCLGAGGSERVMVLLANEFAKRNYAVDMAVLREKEESYTVSDSVKLIRFTYARKNKIYKALWRFFKLRKVLKEGKYDYAVSFMYDINLLSLIANYGIGVPMFISERADPGSRNTSKMYSIFEHFMYSRAKGFVFQTEQVMDYYSKLKVKKAVIPNPINEKIPEVFCGERDKRIVGIGRLAPQKNFKMLISAFAVFHQEHSDYILEIYGKGPLQKELEAQIAVLGLEESVFLRGYADDVDEKIRTAAMYVSSSDFEGISNAMLEAMAMGVPVVCTDCPVGGAGMVINHGENGYLCAVNDENELIQYMNEALLGENPKRIGSAAVNVRERFGIVRIADSWVELFENA